MIKKSYQKKHFHKELINKIIDKTINLTKEEVIFIRKKKEFQ